MIGHAASRSAEAREQTVLSLSVLSGFWIPKLEFSKRNKICIKKNKKGPSRGGPCSFSV